MVTSPRPIALAGIGKIARDAHIPALRDSDDWEIAAAISRNDGIDGVETYGDIDSFLEARPEVETVSLALPPGPRFAYAVKALRAGRNVMLEKPPGRTLAECETLVDLAKEKGVSLFASWHSRMGSAVRMAADRLDGARIDRITIDWREDVRRTHPGQDWIWAPGSLGVFDPGINAFSILVRMLDRPVHVQSANLLFPENRGTPIAATVDFAHPEGAEIRADLDFRHDGDPVWDIIVESDRGTLTVGCSGSTLSIDGTSVDTEGAIEYPAVYARFADLVRAGESEVDLRPLRHVADAFLIGAHERVAPFEW